MGYLLDFIHTFQENELAQFRGLDLKGKEELIRDEYLKNYQNKQFDEFSVLKKFNISTTHLDKVNSILLSKITEKLYQNDLALMLQSMKAKGLSQLLIHQIKIGERKISNAEVSEITAFYKVAVEALSTMFHPTYNSKLTHAYGKKYINSLPLKKRFEESIYQTLVIGRADMLAECLSGNEEEYRAKAYSLLTKCANDLKKSKSAWLWFQYEYTWSFYYKFFGTEVKPFISALQNSLEHLKKCKPEIQKKYNVLVLCEIGFGLLENNQIEEALAVYKDALENLSSDYKLGYYQYTCYFNTALLNKEYKLAQNIFHHHLKKYLSNKVNRSLRFDVLVNGFILQLYVKNHPEAFDYLQEMKAYKKNEITYLGQIILRVCESLYFYNTNDFLLAKNIIQRNIKFLNRPENKTEQYQFYYQFFNSLLFCNQAKLKNKEISKEEMTRIGSMGRGQYRLFSQLL